MILLDYSQIFLAPIHQDGAAKSCAQNPSDKSRDAILHYVFNSVRALNMAHKKTYGQMVIACDETSWRKTVFPQYKWTRKNKKTPDTSGIDWEFVFEVQKHSKEMLLKYFPYPLISVPGAEGDDIIGVLTKHISTSTTDETDMWGESEPEKILIVSSDKDNFQLHRFKNVKQYDNIKKKLISLNVKPEHALIEKIVRGDISDSIPSIKCGDTWFSELKPGRAPSITQVFLEAFFNSPNPIDACLNEVERINYRRNEQLVSYECIPENIYTNIVSVYNSELERLKTHSKMKLMSFLAENKMNVLYSKIGDFY